MLAKTAQLPLLRDLDQPFTYDISMPRRSYRLEFYDTSSPESYTLLEPNLVVLCYDIKDRRSLINVQQIWRKEITRHYRHVDDEMPVMLLGLKRDLRVEEEGIIYPQEVSPIGGLFASRVLGHLLPRVLT